MPASELPSGALTFFFSDIEGSTRVAAALGDEFAPALEAHRAGVRAAIADGLGVEVSTAGDSFFAVFEDPLGALRAAVAIQRDGMADGAGAASLRARIGLHTGHAMRIGNDFVGLDVHRAARIEDAGHGGQILVSETTRELLAGGLPPGLTLVDLGRHRLKDVGPERLWQIAGPGLPAGPFPALRSLEAHPTNLPADSTPLVDRDRERTELTELVVRTSLVTVTGPGGVGKSRLAVEVARSLVERFPDGVFKLELAAISDAASIVAALVETLGLRILPGENAEQALLDGLRNREVLLLLDTADRAERIAGILARITSTCPRIRVLVTSRSPVHAAAEHEYGLGPLAGDPAAELFETRARAIKGTLQLDDAARAAVRRLVARLDGLPLAIELAAARTKLFSPAALLDRLERRLPTLGEGGADMPDRHRTLNATIAWSCELLSPAEQAAFAQLAVFAGSFALEAVERVVELPDGSNPTVVLETLVDRSLVVADDAGNGGDYRFRLLGPIREFARDALHSSGSEAVARERHTAYWLDFIRRESEVLAADGDLATVKRIGEEEAEIRQALDWCLEGTAADAALEIAGRLGRYWRLRGRVTEGLQRLTRSLDQATGAAPAARARALFWTGVLYDDAGQPADAAPLLESALQLQRELGDDAGAARTLNSLGVVARSAGDLDRAERQLEESIERFEALGDRRGIAMSLSNLGIVAADRGRHDVSVDLMTRSLEIDAELGGAYVFIGRVNLGATLVRAGRTDEGLEELARSLPGIEELEDPELVEEVLTSLSAVALARNDAYLAARLLFAADVMRAAEHMSLDGADQREVEDLHAGVAEHVQPALLAGIREEAATLDVDAALALAHSAVAELRESKRPEEPRSLSDPHHD